MLFIILCNDFTVLKNIIFSSFRSIAAAQDVARSNGEKPEMTSYTAWCKTGPDVIDVNVIKKCNPIVIPAFYSDKTAMFMQY
jgi:hypothetical protein